MQAKDFGFKPPERFYQNSLHFHIYKCGFYINVYAQYNAKIMLLYVETFQLQRASPADLLTRVNAPGPHLGPVPDPLLA